MARLLECLTLDKILECNLTAQAAFAVLGDLEAALRGTPDTALPPQASRQGGRRAVGGAAAGGGTGSVLLRGVFLSQGNPGIVELELFNGPLTMSKITAVAPPCRSGAASAKRCCSQTTPLPCTSCSFKPPMPGGTQRSWARHQPGCPRHAARRPPMRRASWRAGRATPPGSSSSASPVVGQQHQACMQLLGWSWSIVSHCLLRAGLATLVQTGTSYSDCLSATQRLSGPTC